jgi:hypothetical protein
MLVQAIALSLTLLGPAAVRADSTVSGTVIDSRGMEIPNAMVEALPRPSGVRSGSVGDHPNPWIQTDSHGRFRIKLPPGRYKIEAKAEMDGHPDPIFMLNTDPTSRFPEISVQQQNISGVHVVLGKRGGVLAGEVVDQSGRSIANAKVTIRDARNPHAYVEVFADKNGQFQVTVLSKPLLISATAAGYRASSFAELTLSQGEKRRIVLTLQQK